MGNKENSSEEKDIKTDITLEKKDLDDKSKKKKIGDTKKKTKIIFIVLIILVIGLAITCILFFANNKKLKKLFSGEVSEEKKILTDAKKNALNNYGLELEKANLEYFIKYNKYLSIGELIANNSNKYKISCNEQEAYDDGTIYLNDCTAKGVEIDASYGTKKDNVVEASSGDAIIEENSIIVFAEKTTYGTVYYSFTEPVSGNDYERKVITTNKLEKDNYFKPQIISNKYIYYFEEGYKPQLKEIATNKKVAESEKYDSIYLVQTQNSYYNVSYAILNKNSKLYLYNVDNNKYINNNGYEDLDLYIYGCGTIGPKTSFSTLYEAYSSELYMTAKLNGKMGVIDIRSGKEIIPLKYDKLLKQDRMIIASEGSRGYLFDLNGKEYLKDNDVTNVFATVNNAYALVNQKGKIKLLLINGTELYNYGELNIKGLHISSPDVDKVSFEVTTSDDYSSCIDLEYDFISGKGSSENKMCAGISKPILYLYPEKKEEVIVTFDNPEVLETTYPKYKDKWEVTANTDGSLYDKNGKYYYALYWDEQKIHTVDFKEGFYVTKNNAIEFLEEKLDYIGLSPKEKNEFIMYWLPILEKNKKSLVYFELTEERDSYSKINITPKPDSMLRLVIHIKKVKKKTDIKEQNLTSFDRTGFTAVEWGGTTY